MKEVSKIEPDWVIEAAPHFYEDSLKKKAIDAH